MGHTKHGNTIANEHRKKAASLPFRLAGYVTGNTGVNWVKSMTDVERHAELVYAESLFEKVRNLGFTFPFLPPPQLIIDDGSGSVGDRLFRRLARIYQGSVRIFPT